MLRRSPPIAAVVAAILAVSAPSGVAHAPHDVVDAVAVSPDYAQDRTLLAAIQLTEHRFLARSTDGGRSWAEYGGLVSEHSVESFAFSPDFANDKTVFAATIKDGVYKSTDGGVTWSAANLGLRSTNTHRVAVSPSFATDQTLFAATDVGLYRSTNGGATWTKAGTTLPSVLFQAVEFGATPNVVFAASEILYRSVDGGKTWLVLRDFRRPVKSLAVSPSFATDLTLGVSFGRTVAGGVLVSVDGGASFGAMDSGLTDPYVNRLVIADDGTFFAVSEAAACFRADHAFGAWTLFSEGFEELATQTESHYFSLEVSPTFSVDGEVFVGGHEGLFRSEDRGEHWRQADVYHQRINRFLVVSPDYAVDGEAYAGNYGGGPFRFTRSTGTWKALGHGVPSLWCGSLELSPSFATDGTMFYGYNGTWRSTDRGATWTGVFGSGDVTRSIAMTPTFATDQTMLLNAASLGTHRSTDAGATWTPVPGLPVIRINHLRFDPRYPAVKSIYATPQGLGVWRSDDDGATWNVIAGPMTGVNVRDFQISPDFANDGVLIAGTVRKGLYRSNDRGNSWTPFLGLPAGAEDTIESIAFSPDYAVDRTIYVVSLLDGLFVTTDDGGSFQPRNVGLPADAKRVVRTSPSFAIDQTVFVTTHDWTYRSQDRGLTWQKLTGYVRVDDKHPTVFYEGTWNTASGGQAFGHHVRQSAQAGAAFEFEFFGNRLVWYARKDLTSGRADVYLDGALKTTVDLYSATAAESAPVWGTTFGANGWHVVRVVVTGQKNPQSTGFLVKSDGFARQF